MWQSELNAAITCELYGDTKRRQCTLDADIYHTVMLTTPCCCCCYTLCTCDRCCWHMCRQAKACLFAAPWPGPDELKDCRQPIGQGEPNCTTAGPGWCCDWRLATATCQLETETALAASTAHATQRHDSRTCINQRLVDALESFGTVLASHLHLCESSAAQQLSLSAVQAWQCVQAAKTCNVYK